MRCAGLLPRRMVSFFECGGEGGCASTDPLIAQPTALTFVGNLPVVPLYIIRTYLLYAYPNLRYYMVFSQQFHLFTCILFVCLHCSSWLVTVVPRHNMSSAASLLPQLA